MKNFILIILLWVCATSPYCGFSQNSTCAIPTGPMAQPDDSVSICYPGYTLAGTDSLTQCYTFTPTQSDMYVTLNANVGVDMSCSFPNTSITYSDFELFEYGGCGNQLASSATFSGLDTNLTYVFCVTLSPFDPACVWISQACPRINETPIVLPFEEIYLSLSDNDDNLLLEWETTSPVAPENFQINRKSVNEDNFETIGSISGFGLSPFQFHDSEPPHGESLYQIVAVFQDGSKVHSNIVTFAGNQSTQKKLSLKIAPSILQDDDLINLSTGGASNQMYKAQLVSLQGKTILNKEFEPLKAIEQEINYFLPSLIRGMYHLNLIDRKGRVASVKLIKN